MNLLTKPDFARTLERFEAWWDCQIIDRPPVTVQAKSKAKVNLPTKQHASLRERWLDMEYAVDRFEADLSSREYLADTVPIFFPNIGPEACGTLFGCELEFGDYTSWSKPVFTSCRQVPGTRPNFENPYWSALRRGTDISLHRSAGRWLTAMADLHTGGDLLASLRDPQELCMELIDDSQAVSQACRYVTEFFPAIFEDLWNRIAAHNLPCTSWAPSLHMGKGMILQCDLICMISPQMFREIILPALEAETRYLQRSFFHLDGPGALRHLDDLLSMEKLNGVQWVYGEGQGTAKDWIDVYRRIQQAGKCMQIICRDFDDALIIARNIRPAGAWLCIGKPYSPDDIQAFCKTMEQWAAGKKV